MNKINQKQKIIAIIPARGGSKGIPRKNILPLAGKPLIAWTIEKAKQSKYIDKIVVSTEDNKIAEISKEYGAEVVERPKELAKDKSLAIDAVKYTLAELKKRKYSPVIGVLLEPTCPMRTSKDIDKCIEILLEKEHLDSVATFSEATLNPMRAWTIEDGKPATFIRNAVPWLPRQKLKKAYQLNGAVYAFRVDKLKENDIAILFGNAHAVIIPKERQMFDIDDILDFEFIDFLIRKGNYEF